MSVEYRFCTPLSLRIEENMAELIITDEERASATYLEWDDASIGRGVKKIALKIGDLKGKLSISFCAGAVSLITKAVDSGAEKSEFTVEGLIDDGQPLGDWKVTVERIG